MSKKIFLTGRPGIGKTTVVKKVIERLKDKLIEVEGFYTQEIRKKGKRVGFEIKGLNGFEGILAHVDLNTKYRVGKYNVKLKDLEKCIKRIEKSSPDLYVIDELGKMELYSKKFKKFIDRLLNSEKRVLAVVQKRVIDRYKNREDVEIVEVNHENRDELPIKILNLLKFDF